MVENPAGPSAAATAPLMPEVLPVFVSRPAMVEPIAGEPPVWAST
ncbi:hypothetical protein [Acidocella sp.]